jgi:regulator of protease activity HflC (stomatin/prohibitin superfamily)
MKIKILMVLVALALSGCYVNDEVGTNQVAVQLEKNKIQSVVGPGVYSDWGLWADLQAMDVDTLTFPVEDPEVLTKDNQAVGVRITIQARRKSDTDSVTNIFSKWSALVDNTALVNTISATAREGMKNGTRGFTLPELLDDRNGLADAIRTQLEDDAQKYSVEIVNVTIENIAPSQAYMAILGETANIKAQTDQEIRKRDLINQKASNDTLSQEQRVKVAEAQVLAEQAETEVQVEIARRAGEVIKASNQVYVDNPQAYELEKMRLLKEIFSDKTVYFIPEGTDLTTFWNFGNGVVPVGAQ